MFSVKVPWIIALSFFFYCFCILFLSVTLIHKAKAKAKTKLCLNADLTVQTEGAWCSTGFQYHIWKWAKSELIISNSVRVCFLHQHEKDESVSLTKNLTMFACSLNMTNRWATLRPTYLFQPQRGRGLEDNLNLHIPPPKQTCLRDSSDLERQETSWMICACFVKRKEETVSNCCYIRHSPLTPSSGKSSCLLYRIMSSLVKEVYCSWAKCDTWSCKSISKELSW